MAADPPLLSVTDRLAWSAVGSKTVPAANVEPFTVTSIATSVLVVDTASLRPSLSSTWYTAAEPVPAHCACRVVAVSPDASTSAVLSARPPTSLAQRHIWIAGTVPSAAKKVLHSPLQSSVHPSKP